MKTTLQIYGMHCSACSRLIENSLNNTSGVSKASVNYATEKAQIIFDENQTNLTKLISVVQKTGYQAEPENKTNPDSQKQHKKKDLQKLKFNLIFSLVLSLPLAIFMLLDFLPKNSFSENIMPYYGLISFLLATPVQFIAGIRYYQSAYASLRLKTFNMDSLITIGTLTAYFYSFFNLVIFYLLNKTLIPEMGNKIPDLYFETSAFLITFVTLGKYLENVSKEKTSLALEKLQNLSPKTANLLKNGRIKSVLITDIKIGDTFIIKPGEKIPLDGKILKGITSIDESLLTGESLPVDKKIGDKVFAGTLNKMGSLEIKTTKLGSETALARIIQFVEDAQSSKAPIADLADKISSVFVPVIILIAVVTFIVWYFLLGQTLNYSLLSFISVIVIACPCALGLATPTAILVGTGLAAQNGILIKGGVALDKATKIDTIVFDKTGTLTKGQPEITDIINIKNKISNIKNTNQNSKINILQIAGSLEKYSEHPLAQAVVNRAQAEKLSFLEVSDFQSLPGSGVTGTINKTRYFLTNPTYLSSLNTPNPPYSPNPQDLPISTLESQGKTVMVLSTEKEILGFIALADTIKESAKSAVKNLKSKGYKIYMLTGDNQNTAQNIAAEVGIPNVLAHVLPTQKAAEIEKLQKEGKRVKPRTEGLFNSLFRNKHSGTGVAFVGDGINDAPALIQADLGIALGRGTDIAIESGDIVILKDDLGKIQEALEISKKTYAKIKTNLFFALIYNVLGIPIAARVFVGFGLVLKPELAGLAMAASSVSVVTNSLLLNFYKPKNI